MPSGTSKEIIGKTHADVVKVLAMPDVRHLLIDLGANELIGSTPEQLANQIRADITKYRTLVRNAGIKVE